MYQLRNVDRERDLMYLIDIDTKSFENAWFSETWEQTVLNNKVLVNTYFGIPVAFAVLRVHADQYGQIVKFAVKPSHQRKGLGAQLIAGTLRMAALLKCRQVKCLVPEPWLWPEDHKLARFLKYMSFEAQKPFLRNAFRIGGDVMDGVQFIFPGEKQRENATR